MNERVFEYVRTTTPIIYSKRCHACTSVARAFEYVGKCTPTAESTVQMDYAGHLSSTAKKIEANKKG